eukprot:CAMPEP_0117680032 /NCGR_PEP_ID=MMETSP0804-20121206/18121_1 /TAXON_ID=1074897 /ORGANISM="Tetraselmis astigmatica, Strain CCMP880" /LENGTH=405 /DNA_ID=CAMNT_0005489473 /DNA_START=486 /DNA_END=1699 /DNA_ORIENTATION=+
MRGSIGSPQEVIHAFHGAGMSLRCRAGQHGAAPGNSFSSVPVLDLSLLERSDTRTEFLELLRDTCHTVGFMYVVNHGVPLETLDGALQASQEFFALPEEEKMQIHHSKSAAFRGYIATKAENTGGQPDLREQVEFGVEGEAVEGKYGTAEGVFPLYERLKGPNLWPSDSQVPGFRSCMESYRDGLHCLSTTLIEALVEALGVPPNSLEDTIGPCPNMQMKIARYPPRQSSHEHFDIMYGVGPHSDSGYLSILLQDDVAGLEVLNGDGEWVKAPPIPGSLVVNLGEMLQLASGGYYLATVHRVQPPPARGPPRFSVPYFFNPNLEAEIRPLPLPATLEWQRPPPESPGRTATHGGSNTLLPRYGDNAFKSLARSHPKVFARHHPDLTIKEGCVVQIAEPPADPQAA